MSFTFFVANFIEISKKGYYNQQILNALMSELGGRRLKIASGKMANAAAVESPKL